MKNGNKAGYSNIFRFKKTTFGYNYTLTHKISFTKYIVFIKRRYLCF